MGGAGALGGEPERLRVPEVQQSGGRWGKATDVGGRWMRGWVHELASGQGVVAAIFPGLSKKEGASGGAWVLFSRMTKTLCVYCSSSDRLEPKYFAEAEAVGREIARRGWSLVYGGGNCGLMGAVARTTKASGGRVIGVIPEFMKAKELAFYEADELVTVQTMRERKLLMEERADAFLALPGGWGTLEEIMEILVLRQLDVLRKPCVFFNQDGFYDDLLNFFARLVDEKFSRPSHRELFSVGTTLEQCFELLEIPSVTTETKWFETR